MSAWPLTTEQMLALMPAGSDEARIAEAAERAGPEAAAHARRRAREIIEAAAADGALGRLAGNLLAENSLRGERVAAIVSERTP